MNELIRVSYDGGRPTVSARELHKFLGVNTEYRHWFPRMCEYGFTEGQDFNPFKNDRVQNEGGRLVARTVDDAQLTIEMAKEICMLQRNERGKQARQYFIQLEKDWNSPEKVMARALQIADQKLRLLEGENAQQKKLIEKLEPAADYASRCLMASNGITTTSVAKNYGMSAKRFNQLLHGLGIQYKVGKQWVLYSDYQNKGYTVTRRTPVLRSNGETEIVNETLWTTKGVEFLDKTLQERAILRRVGDKTVLFKCGECENRWFCEIEPEECDRCLVN